MSWTRSIAARLVSLAAAAFLLVVHWDERDAFFWFALVLVPIGLVGLVVALRARRPRAGAPDHHAHDGRHGEPHDDPTDLDPVDDTLASLWDVPGVADAFASGPPRWRQVSYLDDESFEPWDVSELAEFMWVGRDTDGWWIALGDEVKPHVDLDLDPEDDPLLDVLRSHPGVVDAWHDDREVYGTEQDVPMGRDEFAALAARALVAHHLRAVSRLP